MTFSEKFWTWASRFAVAALLLGIPRKPFMDAAVAPEALFQEAMIKESGERDPESAIALYQQVVQESGAKPLLAAKAQLRMGGCYERLGKMAEAEALYQQIIAESSKTAAGVTQKARVKLERLQAQDEKVSKQNE